MVPEYVGISLASLAIELALSPWRFAASFGLAAILAAALAVGCWRSGRLVHKAYRPGPAVLLVSCVAAVILAAGLMVFDAVRYTNRLLAQRLVGAERSVSAAGHAAEARVCSALALLVQRTRRAAEYVSLECAGRGRSDTVTSALRANMAGAHAWIHARLEWHQTVTLVATLGSIAVLLAVPSYRASRAFALPGINPRRFR